MAQLDGNRFSETHPQQQSLAVGDVLQEKWPDPVTLLEKSQSHDDEQQQESTKKSVLAKVKEKARKWRKTLVKKKNGNDHEHGTPAWGVSLEENEEDDEEPEYHGAPMYESDMAPDTYKETYKVAIRPKTSTLTLNRQIAHTTVFRQEFDCKINNDNNTNGKMLTESVTEMLAPAYSMVTEATQMLTSKMHGGREDSDENKWDKGVPVKEFFMQKLEPGDEERALSQVISEAMSPKLGNGVGEKGVVEKVKGVVSSLMGMEEPTISVSTNSHAAVEENVGRRLQTN